MEKMCVCFFWLGKEIDTTAPKMNEFIPCILGPFQKKSRLVTGLGHSLRVFVPTPGKTKTQQQGALESSLATAVGPASVSILADCIMVDAK